MQKVSVIIPAFDEEENIENVIKTLKQCHIENEVIVVDNCSTDNTAKVAENAGADKVVFCSKQGKGYAMEEGLKHAQCNIVAYIDGDLKIETDHILETLIQPIETENVDFVKSTFERNGGRVTELVTKPLLDLLFPDMYKFRTTS